MDSGDARHGRAIDPDDFREALSHWASTVTVVAVRDEDGGPPGRPGGEVHGVTVTSFVPVSAEPPRVLLSLGPNAKVIPFLDLGAAFAVSFLAVGQERIGSVMADSFPVGPSPFSSEGWPYVEGAAVGLGCVVERVEVLEGGVYVVVATVVETRTGEDAAPLLYHRRGYRTLA